MTSLTLLAFVLTFFPLHINIQPGTDDFKFNAYGSPHGTIAHVLAKSYGLTEDQVTVDQPDGGLVTFTLNRP